MSPAAKDVDSYLVPLPEDQRTALQKLRETMKATMPETVESTSYQIPTFKYKGKPLIYFGAPKNHVAIHGGINTEAHQEELKDYDTSKGTVRFSPDKPLPTALVTKLVKARIKEIETGATGYGRE